MSTPVPAILYTQGFGSRPENVEVPFYSLVPPVSSNVNFPLGKRWITAGGEYVLTSFTTFNGVLTANWTLLGSTGGIVIDSAASTAAMTAGTVNVTDPASQTSSIIIYSANTLNGTVGTWSVIPSNGSFVINSNNAGDLSSFFYIILNP